MPLSETEDDCVAWLKVAYLVGHLSKIVEAFHAAGYVDREIAAALAGTIYRMAQEQPNPRLAIQACVDALTDDGGGLT